MKLNLDIHRYNGTSLEITGILTTIYKYKIQNIQYEKYTQLQ